MRQPWLIVNKHLINTSLGIVITVGIYFVGNYHLF